MKSYRRSLSNFEIAWSATDHHRNLLLTYSMVSPQTKCEVHILWIKLTLLGFWSLTSGDLKWPFISTKGYRLYVLTTVDLYAMCPFNVGLTFEVVCIYILLKLQHLVTSNAPWPLHKTMKFLYTPRWIDTLKLWC